MLTLNLKTANWSDLIQHIGYKEVNKELDTRVDGILHSLQDLASLVTSDRCLVKRISALRNTWLSAKDPQSIHPLLNRSSKITITIMMKLCLIMMMVCQ